MSEAAGALWRRQQWWLSLWSLCGEGLVCYLSDGLDAREEAKDSEGPEAAQDADERDTACGGVRASPVTGSVHGQALRIKEQVHIKEQVQRLGHA
jgi:hypothetical protein